MSFEENDSVPSLKLNFNRGNSLQPKRKFSGPATAHRKSHSNQLPVAPPQMRRHSMLPLMMQPRLSIDYSQLSERRKSTIRNSIFGPTTFSGLPLFFSEEYRKPPKMENTYKMEPDADNKFKPHLVREVVEKVLENNIDLNTESLVEEMEIVHFSGYKQKPIVKKPQTPQQRALELHKERGELSTMLVEEIKQEIKGLNFKRHKIVVNAIIGEKKGQGIRVASRCLWNLETDNSICVQKEGKYCFIVITVHGIYFE